MAQQPIHTRVQACGGHRSHSTGESLLWDRRQRGHCHFSRLVQGQEAVLGSLSRLVQGQVSQLEAPSGSRDGEDSQGWKEAEEPG